MSNIVETNKHEIISKEKVQLLKDTICKGGTDNELELFIMTANKTGLDPLSKQCWAVKRWDSLMNREVMAFHTGIDGFRVIANRSEKYAGQLGPFWCGEDGEWKDVWLKSTPPVAAKIGIVRTDFKEPLWAVAKFSSYAAKKKDGSLTQFWMKMPDLMIAKVAEALALRKAFPQDLSGIYSSEEMDQAEVEKDINPPKKPNYPEKIVNKHFVENKTEEMPEPHAYLTHSKPRNLALAKYRPSNGPIAKYESLAKTPINEALAWIANVEKHKLKDGVVIPQSVFEDVDAIRSYFGI